MMIQRKLLVSIAGRRWIIEAMDAANLLYLTERARQVNWYADGHAGYFCLAPAGQRRPLVESIEFIDVEMPDEEPPTAPQASIYTAAARDLL